MNEVRTPTTSKMSTSFESFLAGSDRYTIYVESDGVESPTGDISTTITCGDGKRIVLRSIDAYCGAVDGQLTIDIGGERYYTMPLSEEKFIRDLCLAPITSANVEITLSAAGAGTYMTITYTYLP